MSLAETHGETLSRIPFEHVTELLIGYPDPNDCFLDTTFNKERNNKLHVGAKGLLELGQIGRQGYWSAFDEHFIRTQGETFSDFKNARGLELVEISFSSWNGRKISVPRKIDGKFGNVVVAVHTRFVVSAEDLVRVQIGNRSIARKGIRSLNGTQLITYISGNDKRYRDASGNSFQLVFTQSQGDSDHMVDIPMEVERVLNEMNGIY